MTLCCLFLLFKQMSYKLSKKLEKLPRKVNAQVVVLRQDLGGNYWVLLQKRSENMFMPGYLGTIGGKRDDSDISSIDTALREVEEESGLLCNNDWWKENINLFGPKKFSEGKNVDWFIIKLPNIVTNDLEVNWFSQSAKYSYECADINSWISHLRPYDTELPDLWFEPFGHAWTMVRHLDDIEKLWKTIISKDKSGKVKLMGGMCNKIKKALSFLRAIELRSIAPLLSKNQKKIDLPKENNSEERDKDNITRCFGCELNKR